MLFFDSMAGWKGAGGGFVSISGAIIKFDIILFCYALYALIFLVLISVFSFLLSTFVVVVVVVLCVVLSLLIFLCAHTHTHTHSRSRVFLIKLQQSHVVFERALQIAIVAFGTILVFNFYFIVAAANAKTNAQLKVTRQQHTTHTSAQLEHSH